LRQFRSVLVSVLVSVLLSATHAAAAQLTLAWDANTETDIAGYVVEYGPSYAPFSLTADAGNQTTWTLANAAPGTTYSFRVVAYNAIGERSAPSDVVTTSTVTAGGPTLTPDRAALTFGTVAGGTRPTTSAQTIRLTQSGAGAVTWTATSTAPWLQVSPAAGSGSGAFTVTTIPTATPASSSWAMVTIAADGTSNVVDPIVVSLNVLAATGGQAPIGAVDTPTDNATGVTGSLAITGWALDDVGVSRVRIYRDAVTGEAPGPVWIGDAMQVEDARPDVAAIFWPYPASYRAGWGYLVLTNMLPNQGNGTFRFSAYAEDADGHASLLGSRTITCTNATATQPFGAIDTPAPGETVSGSIYTSFGWVLSRTPKRADVPGGGNVSVLIDGVVVGTPSGWAARSDLTSLFPAAQYPGVNSALAAFAFDTTSLANGMHTIAWVVTDNEGSTSGVGSRYFRVFNGSASMVAAATASSSSRTVSLADEVFGADVDTSGVEARRGYSLDVPLRHYRANAAGRVVVHAEELDRIEVKTRGASAGYLVSGGELRPLPIGSGLDAATGVFVWQPGPGFVGKYDLVFVRHAQGRFVRQDVSIVLNPKGSNRVGPQIVIDLAGPVLGGWAVDLDAPAGTGIDTLHVWAYPRAGGDPIFVGAATYGGARPDVAAVYGDQFKNSGYGLFVRGLDPGSYDLAVFAWSTAKQDFLPAKVVPIEIK
jgi:hypothetical protein